MSTIEAGRMRLDDRRAAVEELYCRGLSQPRIARDVGVTAKTIAKDLQVILETWRHSVARNFDEARARELAKINNLEAIAWRAWERSCRDLETTKVVTDGEKKRAEKTTRTQSGDPAFLYRVSWCIGERCKILGLATAKAIEEPEPDGEEPTPEQARTEFDAILAELRERAGGTPPADPDGSPAGDDAHADAD